MPNSPLRFFVPSSLPPAEIPLASRSNIHTTETEVAAAATRLGSLSEGLNQALFGQRKLIDLVFTGSLAQGHILLKGLPRLGGTEPVKGLSKLLECGTKRV